MAKEIIHSLILIFTIALGFLFPKSVLVSYDLQIAASLFIFFFLVKKLALPNSPKTRLLESVIFTLIVLLIVNTTGSIRSPFFFLIYFLLFSLSLLLEPIISMVTSLTLIIFFLLSLEKDQNFSVLLPIFSLAFITPFALFLGKEYEENQKLKAKSQKSKEETFLFLSLILKNHLKNIAAAAENFLGDHQLSIIKKQTEKMEKLIEKFEKSLSL
jgi:hypothetical protein